MSSSVREVGIGFCFAPVFHPAMRHAAPYAHLSRADFDDTLDFVASGGYALKSYERFARIKQDKQGRWRVANPKVRQSYRLNVGTIVESDILKVRLVRGAASVAKSSRSSGSSLLNYPAKLAGGGTKPKTGSPMGWPSALVVGICVRYPKAGLRWL